MIPNVRLTDRAELDLHEARRWYRENAPHVDQRFRQSVRETLRRIGNRPVLYPVVHRDIRHAPVRRFPYSVFYRFVGETALIVAIVHQARNPETWKGR
jgi:plasmid stabilization system protein ParE